MKTQFSETRMIFGKSLAWNLSNKTAATKSETEISFIFCEKKKRNKELISFAAGVLLKLKLFCCCKVTVGVAFSCRCFKGTCIQVAATSSAICDANAGKLQEDNTKAAQQRLCQNTAHSCVASIRLRQQNNQNWNQRHQKKFQVLWRAIRSALARQMLEKRWKESCRWLLDLSLLSECFLTTKRLHAVSKSTFCKTFKRRRTIPKKPNLHDQ